MPLARLSQLLAALAAAALLAVPAVASAEPGDYTQILCADPETGRGAGIGTVEGLTAPGTVASWRAAIGPEQCSSSPVTDATAIKLASRSQVYLNQGDFAALHYRVDDPALILRAARYFRALRVVRSTNSSGSLVVQHGGAAPAAPDAPINSADAGPTVVDQAPRGRTDAPFARENEVHAEHLGRHFTIVARCHYMASCNHDAGDWAYSFYGGEAQLHDSRPPVAEDVAASATAGAVELTFTARDEGAGLYRLRVWVDGEEYLTRVLPGELCRDVNPANQDPYEFAAQHPCPKSLARTERLELASGVRHVRAVLEDAGGNQTELVDRAVKVESPSPGPIAPALPAPYTAIPAAVTTGPTAPALPEFPGAKLTLGIGPRGGATLRTSYTARPLVRGRLVDATGRAIARRPVTLSARDAAPGTPSKTVATATTGADGTFTVTLPPGASRTVTASFEVARASVRLVVPASVTLRIGRATTHRPTRLSGRLVYAPRAGVLVQVQALDGRRWRTFDTTKTRPGGTFRYAYRFKPTARGRTFALRVLVESPTYPFARGASKPVRVRVRG